MLDVTQLFPISKHIFNHLCRGGFPKQNGRATHVEGRGWVEIISSGKKGGTYLELANDACHEERVVACGARVTNLTGENKAVFFSVRFFFFALSKKAKKTHRVLARRTPHRDHENPSQLHSFYTGHFIYLYFHVFIWFLTNFKIPFSSFC